MTEVDKKPTPRRRPLKARSPDPVEIALEAAADSPEARDLLASQRRLIDADLRHRSLQITSERGSIALKVLTAFAGLAAATLLGILVWDASRDRSLVIEPFSTPPEIGDTGLTGQVLATKLLDRLSAMDRQTVSVRGSASYASTWSGDAKVEIPTTGVSVGELQRFLRSWLGKQTRISGELVRTPNGLSLTVRSGAIPGVTAVSKTGDIDELLEQAAEQLYANTQPYRYSVYLRSKGQVERSLATLRALTRSPDLAERPWAWSGLSVVYRGLGEFAEAERAARRALALDPKLAPAVGNIALAAQGADHPETQLNAARNAAASYARFSAGSPAPVNENMARMSFGFDDVSSNYLSGLRRLDAAAEAGEIDLASEQGMRALRGMWLIRLHEPAAAEREFALVTTPDTVPTLLFAWVVDRRERQDWAGLVEASRSVVEAPPTDGSLFVTNPQVAGMWRRTGLPWVAYAYARTGDWTTAARLIGQTPEDGFEAQLARAWLAQLRGDGPASDRWFARAARENPSIPRAWSEWARALLERRDLDGAIAKARQGGRAGPNFADPLQVWGEALLERGDARAAEAKFREAAAFAPRWGRNRLFRGDALAKLGRMEEARAQWRIARVLDLTPAERAMVGDRLQ